jgi:DNA-directed RNA polymerase specialized sigma24 family protein
MFNVSPSYQFHQKSTQIRPPITGEELQTLINSRKDAIQTLTNAKSPPSLLQARRQKAYTEQKIDKHLHPLLASIIHRRVKPTPKPQDIADLLQEMKAHVWEKIDEFDSGKSNLSTWLIDKLHFKTQASVMQRNLQNRIKIPKNAYNTPTTAEKARLVEHVLSLDKPINETSKGYTLLDTLIAPDEAQDDTKPTGLDLITNTDLLRGLLTPKQFTCLQNRLKHPDAPTAELIKNEQLEISPKTFNTEIYRAYNRLRDYQNDPVRYEKLLKPKKPKEPVDFSLLADTGLLKEILTPKQFTYIQSRLKHPNDSAEMIIEKEQINVTPSTFNIVISLAYKRLREYQNDPVRYEKLLKPKKPKEPVDSSLLADTGLLEEILTPKQFTCLQSRLKHPYSKIEEIIQKEPLNITPNTFRVRMHGAYKRLRDYQNKQS